MPEAVATESKRFPSRLAAALVMLCLLNGAAAIAALYRPSIAMVIDPASIVAESGKAYLAPVRLGGLVFQVERDSMSSARSSRLRLYEERAELGGAHAVHDDIRERGGGRFSHWGEWLYFSASDGSDPRTNGRSYSFTATTTLNVYLLIALAALNLLFFAAARPLLIRFYGGGDAAELGPVEVARPAYPSPFALAALVTVSSFGIAWFCGLTYRTNDDVMLRAIAEGVASGQPSEFTYYQNIVAGLILRALYTAVPLAPWYDTVLAAGTATGALLLLTAALRLCKSRRETIFVALLGLIVFTGTFRNLQFSAAATLLGAGSAALLVSVAFRPPVVRIRMYLCLTAAALAFFWGSLFRWDSAVLGFVLVAPLLVLGLRRPVLALRAPVTALVVALLLVMAGKAIDVAYYRFTPGWENFHPDKGRRLAVSEYLHADFSREAEMTAALRAVGWSRNDYALITGWMFAVPDIFSNDRVTRFAELAPKKSWPGRAADFFQALKGDHAVIWLFVALGALAILLMRSFYAVAVMLVSAGGLLTAMVGLSVVFKPSFFHILWVLCGTVSLAAVTAAFAGTPRVSRRGYFVYEDRCIAIAVLAAACGLALWQVVNMFASSSDSDSLRARLERELTAWSLPPGAIVLAWDANFPFERWVQPFRPHPRYDWQFFHVTHNAVSPLAEPHYAHWGSKDVLWSLCHAPGTYLVESQYGYSSHERMLTAYMREHHGETVSLTPKYEGEATILLECRVTGWVSPESMSAPGPKQALE